MELNARSAQGQDVRVAPKGSGSLECEQRLSSGTWAPPPPLGGLEDALFTKTVTDNL